jgi:WD40 repeat protein
VTDLLQRVPAGVTSAWESVVPRPTIASEIAAWKSSVSTALLIVGPPGTGKSTIATAVLHDSWRQLCSAAYCQRSEPRSISPHVFIEQLVADLVDRVVGFQDALSCELRASNTGSIVGAAHVERADSGAIVAGVYVEGGQGYVADAVERLVRRPLERLGRTRDHLHRAEPIVLVDGLDEAITYYGASTIVEVIAALHDAPLRWVMTTRPDDRVLAAFPQAKRLNLHEHSTSTTAEIEMFIKRYAKDRGALRCATQYVTSIAEASEGVFLYARHAVEDLVGDDREVTDVRLPTGLTGIYRQFLSRELRAPGSAALWSRWVREVRPVLSTLAVAIAPGMTAGEVAAVCELSVRSTTDVLDLCEQYLLPTRVGGEERWTLFHASFREYLLDSSSGVVSDVDEENLILVRYFCRQRPFDDSPGSRYAAEAVLVHLQRVERVDAYREEVRRLHDLLFNDVTFLVATPPSELLLSHIRVTGHSAAGPLEVYARNTIALATQSVTSRASQMELGAIRAGRSDIAEAIAAFFPMRPWKTIGAIGLFDLYAIEFTRPELELNIWENRYRKAIVTGLSIHAGDADNDAQVVTVDTHGRARLWDFVSGQMLFETHGADAPVTCFAATKGSLGHGIAAYGDSEGYVCTLAIKDGAIKESWFDPVGREGSPDQRSAVTAIGVAAGGDGIWVVSGSAAGAISVYDGLRGQLRVAEHNAHTGPVTALVVMKDTTDKSTLVVSSGADGTKFWNVNGDPAGQPHEFSCRWARPVHTALGDYMLVGEPSGQVRLIQRGSVNQSVWTVPDNTCGVGVETTAGLAVLVGDRHGQLHQLHPGGAGGSSCRVHDGAVLAIDVTTVDDGRLSAVTAGPDNIRRRFCAEVGPSGGTMHQILRDGRWRVTSARGRPELLGYGDSASLTWFGLDGSVAGETRIKGAIESVRSLQIASLDGQPHSRPYAVIQDERQNLRGVDLVDGETWDIATAVSAYAVGWSGVDGAVVAWATFGDDIMVSPVRAHLPGIARWVGRQHGPITALQIGCGADGVPTIVTADSWGVLVSWPLDGTGFHGQFWSGLALTMFLANVPGDVQRVVTLDHESRLRAWPMSGSHWQSTDSEGVPDSWAATASVAALTSLSSEQDLLVCGDRTGALRCIDPATGLRAMADLDLSAQVIKVEANGSLVAAQTTEGIMIFRLELARIGRPEGRSPLTR